MIWAVVFEREFEVELAVAVGRAAVAGTVGMKEPELLAWAATGRCNRKIASRSSRGETCERSMGNIAVKMVVKMLEMVIGGKVVAEKGVRWRWRWAPLALIP